LKQKVKDKNTQSSPNQGKEKKENSKKV
jgi:hypothetical protein